MFIWFSCICILNICLNFYFSFYVLSWTFLCSSLKWSTSYSWRASHTDTYYFLFPFYTRAFTVYAPWEFLTPIPTLLPVSWLICSLYLDLPWFSHWYGLVFPIWVWFRYPILSTEYDFPCCSPPINPQIPVS